MVTKRDKIGTEIESIRKRHRGVLRPVDVVEFAQNEKTALHSKFEWVDTEAAHQYRLWQARELITALVTVVPQRSDPVQAFVSLDDDRRKKGGGYREINDVLADPAQREALLVMAKRDMLIFQQRYGLLEELVGVFEAMRAVRKHRKTA